MPELHETRMGQRFLEGTAPRIADALERLNQNLEALVRELRARRTGEAPEPEPPRTA